MHLLMKDLTELKSDGSQLHSDILLKDAPNSDSMKFLKMFMLEFLDKNFMQTTERLFGHWHLLLPN